MARPQVVDDLQITKVAVYILKKKAVADSRQGVVLQLRDRVASTDIPYE
jgi:hypothetical protein